jgi:CHAD domain-containing protein
VSRTTRAAKFVSTVFGPALRGREDPSAAWAKAVARAERRLAAADRAPPEPAIAEPNPAVASLDQRLHDARKAYKRARYAVEVLAQDRRGKAGKRANRQARRLTRVQDLLGAYQDTVTSRELLRTFGVQAHLDGENGFTYGLLYAKEQTRGEENLARLPEARRRAERGKARRWLE